ncbi:Ubiquitin system component CUE [Dillenia turbinata]|uniref:Ubiquitin system component CUE n=1 Tax=Dillenia turbinata TaxID=194707 RepID=A0AAN8ZBD9_9MAGN
MKTGKFCLNPYAASYVPLASRKVEDNKFSKSTSNSLIYSDAHGSYKQPLTDNFILKGQPSRDYHGSTSHNQNETSKGQIVEEEFEMDIAYLQMTFPALSEDSLAGVYLANNGDLEATVDMLSQLELEIYGADDPQHLPGSMTAGEVSDSAPSAELASLKLKNVADDTAAPSISAES